MTAWLEFARALSPALVALAGVVLAGLRTYDRYLHRKALMTATPEQREALEKMPVPSPLYDRGGALMMLLAVGLTLVDLPRLVEDRADRALRDRLQYARQWICSDCQPAIGDFHADSRRRGMPVYEVDDVPQR